MGTKANVLVGFGTLYIAPSGEALPELDDLAPPAITITPGGNWTATGFTLEDHELQYEPEWEDVEVNERNVILKKVLVKEGGMFKVRFMERDAAALNYAIAASTLSTVSAGADQTAQDILKLGDGTVAEKSLLYLHSTPEGGSRVIHMPLVVATGGLLLPWKKATSPYDVEFTMLSDESASAGARLLTVYDITAVATS